MAESDEDECDTCKHARSWHQMLGDDYDADYYDCLVEGCSCRMFRGEDDRED